MKPDPNDRSAWRAYAVISNAIAKAHEGGPFMRLSERERIAEVVWDELAAHGVKVEGLAPQCDHVHPGHGRCRLVTGHPAGPMYNFHPEVIDGHMYDDDSAYG